jgi:hypothetical protein
VAAPDQPPTVLKAALLMNDGVLVDEDDRPSKGRLARVGDLTLIDQAADETSPRCIDVCCRLDAHEIDLASGRFESGKRFKIAPDRLPYAVRWKHKGQQPDLDLTLAPPFARAPEIWFPYVTTMLLGLLQEADLHYLLSEIGGADRQTAPWSGFLACSVAGFGQPGARTPASDRL